MAFCMNCGKQLPDEAKYCSVCGTATGGVRADKTERKTVYDGEIHKCPNCGELLNAFMSVCPTCGYEVRDTRVSNSVKEFAETIINTEDMEKKINLIRNFPIPNTKEDVIEFMVLASSNVLKQSGELCEAWRAKFEQSYQKAKLILNGEDLLRITTLYEETIKKIRADNLMQGTKQTGKLVGNAFTAIFAVLAKILKKAPQVLGFLARNGLSVVAILVYLKAIHMDQLGDNGVGFQLLGGVLSGASAGMLMRKDSTFLDVAFVSLCGLSSFFLANFLENGVFLRLMGVVTLFIVLFSFIEKNSSED